MSNRRYHIHVVCADDDQRLVLHHLAVFFQGRAFLTYDVSSELPKAAQYGRQCIDACDYVIVVIGDSYGTVKDAHVSQMHLSYLNAKTKLKPLLVLIKDHHYDKDFSRQLLEFRRVVTKQTPKVYYYDTDTNIEQLITNAYQEMLEIYGEKEGWIKANKEIAGLKAPLSASTKGMRRAPNSNSASQNKIHDLKASDGDSKAISHATNIADANVKLADTFEVQYSAQAYEGGNLSDVTMSMILSWQELSKALATMPATFSNYGLQTCINRLIASKAESDIKEKMPNVHAVSRCQIAPNDLNKLQKQLVAANWIELTSSSKTSQALWKLTFHIKSLLEKKGLNSSAKP